MELTTCCNMGPLHSDPCRELHWPSLQGRRRLPNRCHPPQGARSTSSKLCCGVLRPRKAAASGISPRCIVYAASSGGGC
jgi:hypothetical protein